jgi:hypothetical protein
MAPEQTGRMNCSVDARSDPFLACMDAGDFVFAGHIAFEVVWQAVERGDRIEAVLNFSQPGGHRSDRPAHAGGLDPR